MAREPCCAGKRQKVLAFARNPFSHHRRITDIGVSKAEVCCREILEATTAHLKCVQGN